VTVSLTPRALAVGRALPESELLHTLGEAEIRLHGDSVWMVWEKPEACIALRLIYAWGASLEVQVRETAGGVQLTAECDAGTYRAFCRQPESDLYRNTTSFKPRRAIAFDDSVRDLYLFGPECDPRKARGEVHAHQRGLNAGTLQVALRDFGTLFYFQDFSPLQEYFRSVEQEPSGVVAGPWPELGYQMPTNPETPLEVGKTYCLSDTLLAFRPEIATTPQQVGAQFIDCLGQIYCHLERPCPEVYDWPGRAKRTLRDLTRHPGVRRHDFGQTYVRPYLHAEFPDSMAQMSIIASLVEYGKWRGRRTPFVDRLAKGMRRFYDPDLRTLRRYLPNVGDEKDPNEVDSWYMYHPLMNLARVASHGEEWARQLLFDSLDFAIEAAHRFDYDWPVKYQIPSFETTQYEREEGQPGQSDVGGIYAYLMLQAFDLSEDQRYVEEAKKAIQALRHHTFELVYQSNLTAFGAAACARLRAITGEEFYGEQAQLFLANFLHNSVIWKSELGHARAYETFLGVSCLHDGEYMAAFECFESFLALREMIDIGRDFLPAHARLLAAESSRFALARGHYFFPDELPEEALAQEIRNGDKIERDVSIPVEDLYPNGKPAGAVGQEVYGAGMPFTFCARAYYTLPRGEGWLFCDYPIRDLEVDGKEVTFRTLGSAETTCRVALLKTNHGIRRCDCETGEMQEDGSILVPGDTTVNLRLR
jgi:hypothetical protein